MAYGKIIASDGSEVKLNVEVHPGEVLQDELEARALKPSSFAMSIGLYPSHLLEIIKKKRNMTAYVALKLELAFGVEAEFWLSLQMKYDLYQERHKTKEAA